MSLQSSLAKAIRSAGQSIDAFGRIFEVNAYVETLKPSTRSIKFGQQAPKISGAFIAPSATVIGNVQIGASSSVWYGAVVRGDVNKITIGDSVTIGDRAMVHVSGLSASHPTSIGDRVVVGAGAIVHGCTLEDDSVVGEGAQVLDGATVQKHAIVAPGSVVSPKKTVLSGQLWAGVPAVYVRDVTAAEIATIGKTVTENVDLASLHALETAKSWETIELEEYDWEQKVHRNESYFKRLSPDEMSYKLGELERHEIPGRILDTAVSARTSADARP